MSQLAKKNPNFKLNAYQQIHKMRMNERLLQTLQRNDIERPKVLEEKSQVLKHFEPNLEYIPEVKNTLREELKKRKKNQYADYWHTRHIYTEMLEYIHTRFDPDRLDNPSRALELAPYEKKLMTE